MHPLRRMLCHLSPLLALTIATALWMAGVSTAGADCPPGTSVPITSGDPAEGPPVILTGLGPAPTGYFFVLGAADTAHSGTLPASAWLRPAGDVDGDGLPDWLVDAPGAGPGGWGDPRTAGCPATMVPDHPPLVVIIQHVREDLDGDGKFDVYEDFLHKNNVLDPGEDLDGDGRLTPSGHNGSPGGCEGVNREDKDCDGHLDTIDEDPNGNGICDPTDPLYPNCDLDHDGHLDRGDEDRNHDNQLNDRPVVSQDDLVRDETGNINPLYPYGAGVPSPGGVIVLLLAWNGTAYSLQGVPTPGDALGPVEDLDHDGRFDVFEDLNHNGILDPGEDLDGDGRLTPPGGCEGVTREDKDCDGHLDMIDEDPNGNGICDPSDPLYPACDLDGDGHLDRGDEDRNHNQILDDRPVPAPGDIIENYVGGQFAGVLPWTYPYVAAIPRPYRLLHADPIDTLTIGVTGAHSDPNGALRARFDLPGVTVHADPAATGTLFDHLAMSLNHFAFDFSCGPPGSLFPCHVGPPLEPPYSFAESGSTDVILPSAPNLAAGAFLSIESLTPRILHPVIPLDGRGRSQGSDVISTPPQPDLLDADGDGAPLPLDTCPTVFQSRQIDTDLNGIGDACDRVTPVLSGQPDHWSSTVLDPSPGMRDGAAAAFDTTHGVLVLFGGAYDRTTWEYDGHAWHEYTTALSPEARRGHGMVWDRDRNRVELYGGERLSDGTPLGDQWEYDAMRHQWTQRRLLVTPGPRAYFGLARDEQNRALVLFGGRAGDRALGDTWVLRGLSWRPVPSPLAPPARFSSGMTWDARRQVTVLAGGRGHSWVADLLDDVWEFDGATWQPVDYRGDLPPGGNGVMVYDPVRRETALFGGRALRQAGQDQGDILLTSRMASTRLFDGVRFHPLATLMTTSAREDHVAAFDTGRGVLVVQGGTDAGGPGLLLDTAELFRASDADGDGIDDGADDCPYVADPDQADRDHDGAGDACDNCPDAFNPTQRDLDRDLTGDACDDDIDGDGVPNLTDACPAAYVPGRAFDAVGAGGGGDADGDGIPDDCDACPHDPANDADHDGICGDRDNCPANFNPMQTDSDADGAGDACQPHLRIVSIVPAPTGLPALNTTVELDDPDGDALHGSITIRPAIVLPDIITGHLDPCSAAWLPDGVPGEGLVFGQLPGNPPVLADVDSAFGCRDGLADFLIAMGTCATAPPESATGSLPLLAAPPFPICVRRSNGGAAIDAVVERNGGGMLVLSGPTAPLITTTWAGSRLPFVLGLGALPGPGIYVLGITATDGNTPEVSDHGVFDSSGQRWMTFRLQRRMVR